MCTVSRLQVLVPFDSAQFRVSATAQRAPVTVTGGAQNQKWADIPAPGSHGPSGNNHVVLEPILFSFLLLKKSKFAFDRHCHQDTIRVTQSFLSFLFSNFIRFFIFKKGRRYGQRIGIVFGATANRYEPDATSFVVIRSSSVTVWSPHSDRYAHTHTHTHTIYPPKNYIHWSPNKATPHSSEIIIL